MRRVAGRQPVAPAEHLPAQGAAFVLPAIAAAPLEPDAVPWKALMDQYTRHVQALLKVDPATQAKARQAQAAAERVKAKAEAAAREFALGAAMSAGVALCESPLFTSH